MELANPQGPMFPHLCGGLEIHSKSHCQFVEIFGSLTSLGESWNMMNLALLQNFDPGLKTVKHCLFEHWIIIARARATSMISRDVSPIALLTRNTQGEVVSHHLRRTSPFLQVLIEIDISIIRFGDA